LLPGQMYYVRPSVMRRLLKDVGLIQVEAGRNKDLGDLLLDD